MSVFPSFHIINRFLEDTCVVVTVGFLISRGMLLPKLFNRDRTRRDQLILGTVFGIIGATEILFPGDRYPYVPFTLAAAITGFVGGSGLGAITAFVMTVLTAIAAISGFSHVVLWLYAPTVLIAALAGGAVSAQWNKIRAAISDRRSLLPGLLFSAFLAGAVAELLHSGLQTVFFWFGWISERLRPESVLGDAAANGLGCLLLTLVLEDAREKQMAIQHRIHAERELTALRMSQLDQLQARLHPHFLFNALAAIAGLCMSDPRKAEGAITDLAALLRRFLRSSPEACVPLSEELSSVKSYLAIEMLRLGDRLQVTETFSKQMLILPVPRFCLQILVENAIQHGVAPSLHPCQISIKGALRAGHLSLIVHDNGVGRDPAISPSEPGRAGAMDDRVHGLDLLSSRLRLAYGSKARLRLRSLPGLGTICIVRLPVQPVAAVGMKALK